MAIATDAEAAAYYNSQPRKRAAAAVLIFSESGELLIVKPNYLDTWLWVGGIIEEGEAPLTAALRECEEEIGHRFPALQPAFINYVSPQPNGLADIVQFIFTTAPVPADFVDSLTLQRSELDEAKFIPVSEIAAYMAPHRAAAIQTYLAHADAPKPLYMENGKRIT